MMHIFFCTIDQVKDEVLGVMDLILKVFKSGKFEYRNDKNGIIHMIIGNTSFSEADLVTNFNYIYDFLNKIKPNKSKGTYFKSIALCSTQSPSIFIEPLKIKWKEN